MLRTLFSLSIVSFLAIEMALLAGVARNLTIDYFDAFEYMSNARVLAEYGEYASDLSYLWWRPPLLPVLQSWIYPSGGGLDAALLGLSRSHLLAWTLSFAALAMLYLHLSREHSRELALLGTFLVAANPMFLHLIPFSLADVPAMLFTLLALDGCLRAMKGGRLQAVLWSVCLAAAMLTKYNLLLLVPSLALFAALSTESGASVFERLRSPRFLLPVIGAGTLWYAFHLGLRFWLEGPSLGAAFSIVRTLLHEVSTVSHVVWDDPVHEYLQEFLQVTPLALVLCTVIGIGIALRIRRPADRLHLLWLTTFLLVMSFAVGSKNTRYLLPALPSLVHLQLRGFSWCAGKLRNWATDCEDQRLGAAWLPPLVGAIGLVLVLWLPVQQAIEQLRHFRDPIYRSSFVERVARAIERSTPIFWRGSFYSLTPEDRDFFPHDETFYFYHFGPSSLAALTGQEVFYWPADRDAELRTLSEGLPGNAALVTSADELYLTHTADRMPDPFDGLEILFIERRTLVPGPVPLHFVDPDHPLDAFQIHKEAKGWAVNQDRLDGWEVFGRRSDGSTASLGVLQAPPRTIELVRVRSENFTY